VSQLWLFDCDVAALGGVYTFAFLSVMTIFAVGNLLLKINRPSLRRIRTVSWGQNLVALAGVALALLGNIFGKPEVSE